MIPALRTLSNPTCSAVGRSFYATVSRRSSQKVATASRLAFFAKTEPSKRDFKSTHADSERMEKARRLIATDLSEISKELEENFHKYIVANDAFPTQ